MRFYDDSTDSTLASTCTQEPCTCASSTRQAPSSATRTCAAPRRCPRALAPFATTSFSASSACLPGTGSPTSASRAVPSRRPRYTLKPSTAARQNDQIEPTRSPTAAWRQLPLA